MNLKTPESLGIRSEDILAYIKLLEEKNLSTHDILIMRGNDLAFEAYWEPFHKDFQHRMYSVSKSFVSLAVGFALQDGLLELDDPMIKHFPEELKDQKDENLRNQTVRNMLMMSTSKPHRSYFTDRPDDRVAYYFANPSEQTRKPGLLFLYDSPGSFVIGALVERLTGKPFMEYLREKMFDKIGVSKEARCLKCPGGHSWGDSAVICTARDLALVARFVMNGGKWNGEQILSKEYIQEATSDLIETTTINDGLCNTFGYGYLFWRTFDNSYMFNGMGGQFGICVPDKDLIFVINADNQGKTYARDIVIEKFFEMIARKVSDKPLPENEKAYNELMDYAKTLKLAKAVGEVHNPIEADINGKVYKTEENPMGIKWFKFEFNGDEGIFHYENAQGVKELPFGLCKNVFATFPQDGYSDEIGAKPGNRRYKCAASAAWLPNDTLDLKVQIIDTYFGNFDAIIAFKGSSAGIKMTKAAEDFLREYEGMCCGTAE